MLHGVLRGLLLQGQYDDWDSSQPRRVVERELDWIVYNKYTRYSPLLLYPWSKIVEPHRLETLAVVEPR